MNDRTHASLRSRFYKSVLLGLSCVFQITIAGQTANTHGPAVFIAFLMGTMICAAISAHEMGRIASAVEMDLSRLKDAVLNRESGGGVGREEHLNS